MTRRPAGPSPALLSKRAKARAKALPSRTRQWAARPGPGITKAPQTSQAPQIGMGLHTADGARKYLTTGERDAFLRAAELADQQARRLCMTLAYAGCPRRWRSPPIASTWPPACWCSRA